MAVAICAFIALVGLIVMPPEGAIIGLIGLPGTAFLAWRMAPKSIGATRDMAIGRAIGLAIATILVSDVLVVTTIAIGATADSGLAQSIAMAIILFLTGLIVVGILVSVIAIPAAIVWVFTVRWLAGRRWAR